MISFPDTSINGLVMLFLAVALASLVSSGLQTALGNPAPASPLQFGIGAIAFLVGFGLVYGLDVYRSYRDASA